jgi:uroporphyrinogen decarboxylase
MKDTMSPRERVWHTLRHEVPDRMPRTLDTGAGIGISGPYLDIFRANTGAEDPADYFDYDIRVISAPLTASARDFSGYHKDIPPGTTFDEFGVGRVSSQEFPMGLHLCPWEPFTHAGEIIDYPFPTFQVTDAMVKQIRDLKQRGYAVAAFAGSVNEWSYFLRGLATFMEDLVLRPELASLILDKVTTLSAQVGADLAEAGADILCFYGDTGGQCRLLISPKMWREWIKPCWQRIFAAVHRANPQARTFFHSCGFIAPLIPDLLEVGMDILNPVQAESMDPAEIKRQYGDWVVLWGGIGLQSTMRAPSPDIVREDVRRLVQAWAPGGGAIPTVTNVLPIDIPWPNVVAVVEAVTEFSRQEYARPGIQA